MRGLRDFKTPTKSNFTKSIETKKALSDALRQSAGIGVIDGPGTGTSDDVPINASDGEAVLPADTVAALGEDEIERLIEETHQPTGKERGLRNFADGGIIKKNEDEESLAKKAGRVSRTAVGGIAKAITAPSRFAQRGLSDVASGFFDGGGEPAVSAAQATEVPRTPQTALRQEAPPPVESSAAALSEDTALEPQADLRIETDPVPGSGIRRLDEAGQAPAFTNLSDEELQLQAATRPGKVSTLATTPSLQSGGSAELTAARRAALGRGDTATLRRELNLAQGGTTAETQRLDDLAAQNAIGGGDSFQDRRRKRTELRRISLRREELSERQQTEAQTTAARDVAGAQLQGDIGVQQLRNQGALAVQGLRNLGDERLASFGGQRGGPGGRNITGLDQFAKDAALVGPTVEDPETGQQIADPEFTRLATRGAQAALPSLIAQARSAGDFEQADKLESQGAGGLNSTQRDAIILGSQLQLEFSRDETGFFLSLFRDPKTGEVSENPLEFVPESFDKASGAVRFVGGQEIPANRLSPKLLSDIRRKENS